MPRLLRAEWTDTIHLPEQPRREERRSTALPLPEDCDLPDDDVLAIAFAFANAQAFLHDVDGRFIGVQYSVETPPPALDSGTALGVVQTLIALLHGYDRLERDARPAIKFSISVGPARLEVTTGGDDDEKVLLAVDDEHLVLACGNDADWGNALLDRDQARQLHGFIGEFLG